MESKDVEEIENIWPWEFLIKNLVQAVSNRLENITLFVMQNISCSFCLNPATSILVTDVGDEMCWRELRDVGDGYRRYRHLHASRTNIYNVTNIEILSPIAENFHQHNVTKIHLSSTSILNICIFISYKL